MIKIRVTNATPVIVGHRQLLPGEVHEVAGGDLNAAVVLYGANAFKILDGAPLAARLCAGGETGEDLAGDATTDDALDGVVAVEGAVDDAGKTAEPAAVTAEDLAGDATTDDALDGVVAVEGAVDDAGKTAEPAAVTAEDAPTSQRNRRRG